MATLFSRAWSNPISPHPPHAVDMGSATIRRMLGHSPASFSTVGGLLDGRVLGEIDLKRSCDYGGGEESMWMTLKNRRSSMLQRCTNNTCIRLRPSQSGNTGEYYRSDRKKSKKKQQEKSGKRLKTKMRETTFIPQSNTQLLEFGAYPLCQNYLGVETFKFKTD